MSPELLELDVEMAALEILASMGWQWDNCFEEQYGDDSELGRDNRGQSYLPKRLKAALARLNPDIPKKIR